MPLLGRKSDDEKQAQADLKAERKEAQRIDKARKAFEKSPAGRARRAFENDDHVFQYELDVLNQAAVIIQLVGSTTSKKTTDPVEILNSVCHEGWELVNGSFVFVQQGQQSRDKMLSSGQNVAIKGRVIGYYLFKRCQANRRASGNLWDDPNLQDVDEMAAEHTDTFEDSSDLSGG
jgi:hypothetical protein